MKSKIIALVAVSVMILSAVTVLAAHDSQGTADPGFPEGASSGSDSTIHLYRDNMFKGEFEQDETGSEPIWSVYVWVYEAGSPGEQAMVEFLKNPYSVESKPPPSTPEIDFVQGQDYVVYSLSPNNNDYEQTFDWFDKPISMHIAKRLKQFPLDIPDEGYMKLRLISAGDSSIRVVAYKGDERCPSVFQVYIESGQTIYLSEPSGGYELCIELQDYGPRIPEVCLEMNVSVPTGSPILYAAICILATAFIGFLLYWNGRVPKLE